MERPIKARAGTGVGSFGRSIRGLGAKKGIDLKYCRENGLCESNLRYWIKKLHPLGPI